MASDLESKLNELKPELDRTLQRERSVVTSQGKPFDLSSWILGQPIDQKYPSGPPYPVRSDSTIEAGGAAALRWNDAMSRIVAAAAP